MSFFYKKHIQTVCLKLTGESLMSEDDSLSYNSMLYVKNQIQIIRNSGKNVCIVLGGGNIYRGVQGANSGIAQQNADYIGMLATVMNCLALSDVLREFNIDTELFSSIPIGSIVLGYNPDKAKEALNKGKVVLFCAGLGHPYFTTDTASVLRALEMRVDVVLKGTKVDGIYTADPLCNTNAQKIDVISYADVIQHRYKVMDITAFSLCQEHNLPIIIYDFFNEESLKSLLKGNVLGTLVTSQEEVNIVKGI